MESKYYLPWDLTVKLALMGYNEASNRIWEKPRSLIKPWKERLRNAGAYWRHNFHHGEDSDDSEVTKWIHESRKELLDIMAVGKEKGYNPAQFAYATRCILTAVSWEQAKEWLRKTYDVDFYERPHVGKTKLYICDPLGQGMNNTRLQARETPLEALKCCIEHMCTVLKPLPISKEVEEVSNLESPD